MPAVRSGDLPNELGAIELLKLPSRHGIGLSVCIDVVKLCGVLCGHVLWTRRLGVPVLRSGNLPNELGAIELHELPSRHGVVGVVCIGVVELRDLWGRHVLWIRRVGVRVLRSGYLPIELGAIELLELPSRHGVGSLVSIELCGLWGRHVLWIRRVGVRVLRYWDLPNELGAIELHELRSRYVLDDDECCSVSELRVMRCGLVSALDRPVELC